MGSRLITFAYPRVRSSIPFLWLFDALKTSRQQLSVSGLPPRAHVLLECHGQGCPFARRLLEPKGSRVALAGLFAKSRLLRPGTTLEITVSAPNRVGKVVLFTIRRSAPPTREELCLPPSGRRPSACVGA